MKFIVRFDLIYFSASTGVKLQERSLHRQFDNFPELHRSFELLRTLLRLTCERIPTEIVSIRNQNEKRKLSHSY